MEDSDASCAAAVFFSVMDKQKRGRGKRNRRRWVFYESEEGKEGRDARASGGATIFLCQGLAAPFNHIYRGLCSLGLLDMIYRIKMFFK